MSRRAAHRTGRNSLHPAAHNEGVQVIAVDGGARSVHALSGTLAAALQGGPAVVPVPAEHTQDGRIREVVRPDEPVDEHTATMVTTSGSTGEPKAVLLSAAALTSSATATQTKLGGPGTWLLATPAHYIGGLQVLIRSLLAGTEPGVLDLSTGFHPDAFASAAAPVLDTTGPSYTALVPTQLTRLLDTGGAALEATRAFHTILIGGAAMPAELRDRARAEGINAVGTYGMSETAGGCVYDGSPLDGVRTALDGDGHVLIAGEVLAHGYRNDPGATAAAFADGWFHTSDRGRYTEDGRLEILGRADDVINTGGVKVRASTVEGVLREHPGVTEACVVGLPDPEWGELVAAAIVAADPQNRPTSTDLATLARTSAGSASAPKRIRFLDTLPLRGPGKVDRAEVRATLSSLPNARR